MLENFKKNQLCLHKTGQSPDGKNTSDNLTL
uniref:Uncharacterized protein n=1 Tax=Arundo donax TaxID=35708 RepID=A0A0A8Z1Q3_ARUDO